MISHRYDPVFSILGSNTDSSLEGGILLVERLDDGLGLLPDVGRMELEVGLELQIDASTNIEQKGGRCEL